MTKTFAVVTLDGQAVQRSVFDGDPLGPPMNGQRYVEVPHDLDVSSVYFVEDEIVPLPKQPSVHHVFDFISKSWIDRKNPELEWEKIRVKRNSLLSASDFTQIADSPMDKAAWADYRSKLRDITTQIDPFSVVWPQKPV